MFNLPTYRSIREVPEGYDASVTPRAIRRAMDLEPLLRDLLHDEAAECFYVVLLDGRHRPTGTHLVSRGCLTWAVVHPREVFAVAVEARAGAVILVHNHPSGDATPSVQDRELTQRLMRCGQLLGIPVLDHVVYGTGGLSGIRSMRALGLMDGLDLDLQPGDLAAPDAPDELPSQVSEGCSTCEGRGCEDCDPIDGVGFADPGGNSALRAATRGNPRNLPCPTCGQPNRLTPADRRRGYQCDACADRDEGLACWETPDDPPAHGRRRPTDPSVTWSRLEPLVEQSMFGETDWPSICLACGEDGPSLDPDVENATCDACGEAAVFGAEAILLHGAWRGDALDPMALGTWPELSKGGAS